jgi:hypothetical protein
MADNKDGIVVRQVSAKDYNVDVNTAVGLSSNGTVHPIPVANKSGEIQSVAFYTESGEKLPRGYYELMAENENLVLEGLKGETLIRMKARMAEIKKYLELTK